MVGSVVPVYAIISWHAAAIIKKVIGTGPDIGHQMHYLISTGNLVSKSGLGLQQVFSMHKYCRPLVMRTLSIQPFRLSKLVNDCSIRVFCLKCPFYFGIQKLMDFCM